MFNLFNIFTVYWDFSCSKTFYIPICLSICNFFNIFNSLRTWCIFCNFTFFRAWYRPYTITNFISCLQIPMNNRRSYFLVICGIHCIITGLRTCDLFCIFISFNRRNFSRLFKILSFWYLFTWLFLIFSVFSVILIVVLALVISSVFQSVILLAVEFIPLVWRLVIFQIFFLKLQILCFHWLEYL